jgi:hypothetical protein
MGCHAFEHLHNYYICLKVNAISPSRYGVRLEGIEDRYDNTCGHLYIPMFSFTCTIDRYGRILADALTRAPQTHLHILVSNFWSPTCELDCVMCGTRSSSWFQFPFPQPPALYTAVSIHKSCLLICLVLCVTGLMNVNPKGNPLVSAWTTEPTLFVQRREQIAIIKHEYMCVWTRPCLLANVCAKN